MYFDTIDNNQKSAVIRIVLLGICSFIIIAVLTIKSVIPSIEKDIFQRVASAVYENKLDNIIVSVSGQTVILEGLVTKQVETKAIQVTSQIRGVENVISEFIIVNSISKTGKTK